MDTTDKMNELFNVVLRDAKNSECPNPYAVAFGRMQGIVYAIMCEVQTGLNTLDRAISVRLDTIEQARKDREDALKLFEKTA